MIAAIIFARMNSNRLIGKVMMPLGNDILIAQIIKRAKKLKTDKVIVATSKENYDNDFVKFLEKQDIECFRGDLENVAKRTLQCIEEFKIDYFIRINGDSPLFSLEETNDVLLKIPIQNYDLITNIYPRSFPYGYSLEILKSNVFKENYYKFSKFEREHVTSFFYKNSAKFRILNIMNRKEELSSKIILTIDDLDSYNNMNMLFSHYPDIVNYSLCEIKKAYETIRELKYD